MNKLRQIPLIKEYRIDKLKQSLHCINESPFDRDRQKDCIMKLYEGKSEKSVFRGMVIPSLRALGLIIGYSGAIRLSANARIIYESQKEYTLHERVLRAIILRIDQDLFGFLHVLQRYGKLAKQDFINIVDSEIEAKNERQKRERILHWLSMLQQAGLVERKDDIGIQEENYRIAVSDANSRKKDKSKMEKYLVNSYLELRKQSGEVVDIADLRESVALRFLDDGVILTEDQFDDLLSELPFATEKYIISFGSSMGAGKLFEHEGRYYRTLVIRMLKET